MLVFITFAIEDSILLGASVVFAVDNDVLTVFANNCIWLFVFTTSVLVVVIGFASISAVLILNAFATFVFDSVMSELVRGVPAATLFSITSDVIVVSKFGVGNFKLGLD